jgi:hypothetical protein
VLAGNKPDDLENLAFRIIARHACESVRADLFYSLSAPHIIQCCALCFRKKTAGAILL